MERLRANAILRQTVKLQKRSCEIFAGTEKRAGQIPLAPRGRSRTGDALCRSKTRYVKRLFHMELTRFPVRSYAAVIVNAISRI